MRLALACFGFVALLIGLIHLAPPWVPAPQLPIQLQPPRCYDALLTNGHVSWLGVACNTPLGVQTLHHGPSFAERVAEYENLVREGNEVVYDCLRVDYETWVRMRCGTRRAQWRAKYHRLLEEVQR